MLEGISPEAIEAALAHASTEEKRKLNAILSELDKRENRKKCQEDFISFVKSQYPDFISGAHHQRIAKLFEDIAAGRKKRVIINLAPRHSKSLFASYLFPAWFLGRFPKKQILQVSNTGELAEGFGRQVRNLLESESYQDIFPDVSLRSDSKSAGRWATNHNGVYYACGVGAALAGRGADLAIVDDPHNEQEALAAILNPGIYDKIYEWYTTGIRQRLQPGGAIVIVMCMTGDTKVLMATGVEKPLQDIRPGDVVATFDAGKLTTAKVKNWRSCGVDSIHKIQTQSGRILRANERHPFLVMNEGVLEWTRLKNLRPGDQLVSRKDVADLLGQRSRGFATRAIKNRHILHGLRKIVLGLVQTKGATGRGEQRQNPVSADLAKQAIATTAKTQTPLGILPGITESIKEKLAQSWVAKMTLCLKAYVPHTTTQKDGKMVTADALQNYEELRALNRGTGLLSKSTMQWSKNKAASAQFAKSHHLIKTQEHIGTGSSASTTATTQEKSEGYCATIATSLLDTEKHQKYLSELRRISDFTTDQILTITPDGEAEVFDVEIDRTENFIANGVVSHNTRWSLRDLTAQVLETAAKNNKADQWEVFEFPAILPSGKPLWPQYWSKDELETVKASIPVAKWQAQYMQDPTSDENAIIKRQDWRIWEAERPPPVEYIIMAMDTAFEARKSADYSAAVFFGVWNNDDDGGQPNLILLNAWRDKLEFPELKAKTLEMYKEWEPDSIIIEKRASGAPLIYELRRMGIPVGEFTPSRGNDKITRLNAIADIFASGKVWRPDTRWAEEVVDEMAAFPNARNDDYVDATSLCLHRYRQGGFIGTQHDEEDVDFSLYRAKRAAYY